MARVMRKVLWTSTIAADALAPSLVDSVVLAAAISADALIVVGLIVIAVLIAFAGTSKRMASEKNLIVVDFAELDSELLVANGQRRSVARRLLNWI